VIEAHHERWTDARRHAEEAVEFARHDPDAIPENTAEIQLILAKAIVHTKGDKKRARSIAEEARATFVKLGPAQVARVRELDKLLASLR
jgi:predicted alternative tryptophan synthase beta-subunit